MARNPANKSLYMPDEVYEYMVSVSLREPEIMRRLREETAKREDAQLQIAPEQGPLLAMLVKLIGAKKTLEVGVFTGYSSLAVALALPDDGRVVACDISEEFTAVARRYWQEAGVAHKVSLWLGPGVQTLDEFLSKGEAGTFDFAFIDANKNDYDAYYERALQLLRPGGLMALDNSFFHGRVLTADELNDEYGYAVQRLNLKMHADERVDLTLLPIADGMTLVRKREDAVTDA